MSQDNIPQRFRERIKEAREKQLEELDLSTNYYSNFSQQLTQIPHIIFELNHLKVLILNGNRIQNLPKLLGYKLPNLIELHLSRVNASYFS